MAIKTAPKPATATKTAAAPASGGATDMNDFLSRMQSSWKKTIAQASKTASNQSFKKYPDGIYIATLTTANFEISKQSNRPQVALGYTVRLGDYDGQVIRNYPGIQDERALTYFGSNFFVPLGIDPEDVDLTQLQSVLDDIVRSEPLLRLQLKSKNNYQNIYINELYDSNHEFTEDEVADIASKADELEEEVPEDTDDTPAPQPPAPTEEEDDEDDGDGDGEGEEGEGEGEVEMNVGDTATFLKDGKPKTGVVTKIDEENEVVSVKVGAKVYPVSFDDLQEVTPAA